MRNFPSGPCRPATGWLGLMRFSPSGEACGSHRLGPIPPTPIHSALREPPPLRTGVPKASEAVATSETGARSRSVAPAPQRDAVWREADRGRTLGQPRRPSRRRTPAVVPMAAPPRMLHMIVSAFHGISAPCGARLASGRSGPLFRWRPHRVAGVTGIRAGSLRRSLDRREAESAPVR